tara:strand:- start:1577 stop:2506 length:930 start_codon:yes stop_codon:yes gene_type:complete
VPQKSKHLKRYASAIKTTTLKEALEVVQSVELKAPCTVLLGNLEHLSATALLPVSLVCNTTHQTDFYERFRRAMMQGELQGTKEEQRAEIEKRMEALDKKDHFEWSLSILDSLIEDQEIGVSKGISGLFNMNLAFLWSIFETFVIDVWITAVNSRPESIGRAVVEERKEFLMKTIFNLAVDSNFNLSIQERIGNISATAYDFTSIRGISKAYEVAFKKKKPKLNSIFKNQKLLCVNALRNVTIHNGGVIDEAYCRMLEDFSKLGDKVELTGHQLQEYANTIIDIVIELIQTIDQFLAQKDNNAIHATRA